MEKNDRVELLSPAGNAAGFYGAVHAGADAVYLAGNQFGARAYAENFTTEELLECIRYGHLLGRKIYLTTRCSGPSGTGSRTPLTGLDGINFS